MLMYVTFVPLALWASINWATLIVGPLTAFLLAGIENIGIMIENPMQILPMAAFCTVIHADVLGVASDWAHGDYVRFFLTRSWLLHGSASAPPGPRSPPVSIASRLLP